MKRSFAVCTGEVNTQLVPFIQWMKLAEPPRVRAQWLDYVLSQVEEHGEEMLKGAKKDRVLGDPDWRVVQQMADLRPRKELRQQYSLLPLDHAASDRAPDASAVNLPESSKLLQIQMYRVAN